MLFKEWNVLLVDDEPDVLTVSKLALRDVRVYDLPLRIFTAKNKAEAIELLNTKLATPGLPGGLAAVAFIDVVMETEHAGLELCDHIRHTMKNCLEFAGDQDRAFTQAVRFGLPRHQAASLIWLALATSNS